MRASLRDASGFVRQLTGGDAKQGNQLTIRAVLDLGQGGAEVRLGAAGLTNGRAGAPEVNACCRRIRATAVAEALDQPRAGRGVVARLDLRPGQVDGQ